MPLHTEREPTPWHLDRLDDPQGPAGRLAGAAIVAPAALSLITTGFPEGAERTRAIGLYGAVSSVGLSGVEMFQT